MVRVNGKTFVMQGLTHKTRLTIFEREVVVEAQRPAKNNRSSFSFNSFADIENWPMEAIPNGDASVSWAVLILSWPRLHTPVVLNL